MIKILKSKIVASAVLGTVLAGGSIGGYTIFKHYRVVGALATKQNDDLKQYSAFNNPNIISVNSTDPILSTATKVAGSSENSTLGTTADSSTKNDGTTVPMSLSQPKSATPTPSHAAASTPAPEVKRVAVTLPSISDPAKVSGIDVALTQAFHARYIAGFDNSNYKGSHASQFHQMMLDVALGTASKGGFNSRILAIPSWNEYVAQYGKSVENLPSQGDLKQTSSTSSDFYTFWNEAEQALTIQTHGKYSDCVVYYNASTKLYTVTCIAVNFAYAY